MDIKKILKLIEIGLNATDTVVANSSYYTENSEIIVNTKKVLNLLHEAVISNPNDINERILRATVDLGMSGYKAFENTPLESATNDIYEFLYYSIPNYKNLEQLGMDFGKRDPI